MSDIKFPATLTAHTPSGPEPVCEKHAQKLVGIFRFMGCHCALTEITEPAECNNCVNENKKGQP